MADLEAGVYGGGYTTTPEAVSSKYSCGSMRRRKGSYRAMGVGALGSPSMTPRFFSDADDDEPRHFLDSCFLCKTPLAGNRDIFMYRGDTPFCSEECRGEQIEMDEAMERNRKASNLKQSQTNMTKSPTKSHRISYRAGTVVAG